LKDRLLSEDGKKDIQKVRELTTVATELGITMAQMALAWTLVNKNVSTVITGASSVKQVKENMKVLDYVGLLTEDVLQKIETILANKPSPELNMK